MRWMFVAALMMSGCMPYGDLPTLEAKKPVVVFEGPGDFAGAARCVHGEIPVDYVLQPVRLRERRTESTVTSGGPMGPYGMQFFWQVRATGSSPARIEVRSNAPVFGDVFADKAVYDAIAACGFTKR